MSSFPRVARPVVVLALVGSALAAPTLATSPAEAAPHVAGRSGAAKPPSAAEREIERRTAAARARAVALARLRARLRADPRVRKHAAIIFDKHWRHPFRSRVIFRVWAKVGRHRWLRVEQTSWRAGSGLGGKAGKDSCHRGVGWLPNGRYSFVQHNHRQAPLIDGRVFELEAKACHNGTVRRMLFLHSEQTVRNTQCRNTRGDDGCRWEVPAINDYRSNGCIKMAPRDLRALTRRFHRYFRAEKRYPKRVVRLRVKD